MAGAGARGRGELDRSSSGCSTMGPRSMMMNGAALRGPPGGSAAELVLRELEARAGSKTRLLDVSYAISYLSPFLET